MSLLMVILVPAVLMLALLAVVTIIAPSWRWPAGVMVAVAVLFAAVWLQHIYASSQPGYNGGPGEGLGLALLFFWGIGCLIASALYGLAVMWWRSYDRR